MSVTLAAHLFFHNRYFVFVTHSLYVLSHRLDCIAVTRFYGLGVTSTKVLRQQAVELWLKMVTGCEVWRGSLFFCLRFNRLM